MSAPSFLQSPEWQAIQERMGRRAERIRDVLLIRHDLPLGFHYWYTPRPGALGQDFFDGAVAMAEKSGAIFLRIDPSHTRASMIHDSRFTPLQPDAPRSIPLRNSVSNGTRSGQEGGIPKVEQGLRPLGRVVTGFTIREAHALQPAATLLINCQQSDDQLLSAMHPKTRYNIRLAERHGVSVRHSRRPVSATDAETFRALLAAAARRDGFQPHPAEHYRILLDVATEQFSNDLFIAEHRGPPLARLAPGGPPLAAAIVNCYLPSRTATYLHGGSSYEHRALMAPYLLHWRIIQACRERGMATYDFGGVDSVRWPGLTRFKQGFGGREISYPPPADYIYRPLWYRLYRLQHRLRHVT